jgi:hypothetical protein
MLALRDRERDRVQRDALVAPHGYVLQFDKGRQVTILNVGTIIGFSLRITR